MVTRCRVLLLIGILMFLIHYHQPEVPKWKKNRRTYSQYNIISFIAQLLLPDFHTFRIRKLWMVNPQTSTQYPFQAFGNLSSKCYFRQQIKYLFSLPDHFINQMNIYFRLSTGSNAMQQTDILIPKLLCYLIMCTLLVFIQRIERYHIVDLNI